MHFEVHSLRDVSKAEADNTWTVTGSKPRLKLRGPTPSEGWHLLSFDTHEVGVEGDVSPENQLFTFAQSTLDNFVLLARNPIGRVAGKRRRVIYITAGGTDLALEPSPWLKEVRIEGVSLRPISKSAAVSMMMADLAGSTATRKSRPSLANFKDAINQGGLRGALGEIANSYEQLQRSRCGYGLEYQAWRARHGVLAVGDAQRFRAHLAGLDYRPLISVVMPVYNPEVRWLREAVESIQAQIYENWELCIADDASTNPEIGVTLAEFAAQDSRIKYMTREVNGHISAATNDAIRLAEGEFVAFMDQDDRLAAVALGLIADSAANADIVYTDEDKIDEHGKHSHPHMKPRWNPELLLGQNYMSHLTAVRRTLLDAAGELRDEMVGSQDHDLLLRTTTLTTADRIVHVPFVAYHWRAIPGSTASGAGEKDYTEQASIRALTDILGDRWTVASAAAATTYRCTPPLDETPLISILIPTRDRIDMVKRCIDSLAQTSYPNYEIVIIDNDSSEPETLAYFEQFDNGEDRRIFKSPGAFNYSKVNNEGVTAARGELLCLLNNDTEALHPDWLSEMAVWALRPGIGAVGAKLLYPDETIQHAGVIMGQSGVAGHGHHGLDRHDPGHFSRLAIAHEVGCVTAACLLTSRSSWEALNGLDTDLKVAFNDVDYCLRVRHSLGQRIIWTPHAELLHHESISRGAEDTVEKAARFAGEVQFMIDRWGDLLIDDPAYSPNQTLSGQSFKLARDPRYTPPWVQD